jgi:hypothetical protein
MAPEGATLHKINGRAETLGPQNGTNKYDLRLRPFA